MGPQAACARRVASSGAPLWAGPPGERGAATLGCASGRRSEQGAKAPWRSVKGFVNAPAARP